MHRRLLSLVLVAAGCLALVGCSSESTNSPRAWSLDRDAGAPPGLDGLANLGGSSGGPFGDDPPLELAGTTWRRSDAEPRSDVTMLRWETFRKDGTISKVTIGQRSPESGEVETRSTSIGTWSIQSDGLVRIEYPRKDLPLTFIQPRAGLRMGASEAWFDMVEGERSDRMRWSPHVYVARSDERLETFEGRFAIDMRPASAAFGLTLQDVRVELDFEPSLETLSPDSEECSVEFQVVARAQDGESEPCEVERSFERSCRVQSPSDSNLETISLDYGDNPEDVRSNWERINFDPPEETSSCRGAARLAHDWFVPLLYRAPSKPSVLVSAADTRWIRHHATEPPPEPPASDE
jgi:hypothetical protein